MKNCQLYIFSAIVLLFLNIWEGPGTDHTAFGKNYGSFLYSYAPNYFCLDLRSSSGRGSAETSEE